ncbi:Stk1 family PASTA domain-containing Ser/Thr kinase [Kitasatospora sp. GP82]|uniref:Stk1 family PASTA domain-containing Ser/Thr kinase n=1 Tax=Kitasatospora sp. GP82 TaxID=3035089 RepID=UPI00247378A2|nr:Stk1 family PASTA domain-containing Ser/Thr kinase [Kitasatospora sp. GP82]MDH6127627.1 beta-lactam-binding protein with PASTA domain/tRNA A-37 threonylcarbamoyl transferase component Bud32 [Kitasatospora sp. GP82]
MEEPRRLGGRYELGGVLGRGGMAEVYLAHDTRLGRSVAVKTLRADMARDPSFQARFRREAQSAASLNHPAIVAVYDTGEDYIDNISIPYIVMEYVEGSTLRELLHSGRRLLPERAMEMTIGILQALEYSHRAGIVHRDIKPANVMLTKQGNVKVMDFGIARAMGDAGMTMTQTSAVIGTAQYLSPEQAKGETVDARSDLYSTGCLLYELLTLRPPFVGDSPVAVAYQHVREEAMPPSSYDAEVRPEVDAIVLKALAKERDYRYQSADEMRDDIERFLDGLPVAAAQQAAAYGMGAPGYGYDQQGYAPQHDPYGQTNLLPQQGAAGPTTMMPPVGGQQPGYGDTYGGAGGAGGGYDDGYDRGGRRQEPKKSNTSWIILAIAAVLVLVGAYFVVDAMTQPGGAKTSKVSAPNLVGKSMKDAQAAAAAVNDKLQVTAADPVACPDTNIQKDQVCTQEPPAGSQISVDTPVKVHLNSGPAATAVPDVTGKSLSAATDTLTKAGFTVGNTTYQTSDTVAQDKVVSQSVTGNAAPNTAVDLVISQGKSKTTVPSVIGLQSEAARQQLEAQGFQVTIKNVPTNDPTKIDIVADQDPKGNSKAANNATVTLSVFKAPDKVLVPILVGKTYKQAFDILQQKGLLPQVIGPQDENAVVFQTDPQSSTPVDQGSTVRLFTKPGDPRGNSPAPNH